jgi:hypothetical protein
MLMFDVTEHKTNTEKNHRLVFIGRPYGLVRKARKNYQGCVAQLSTILGTIQTILTNFKPDEKASFSINR